MSLSTELQALLNPLATGGSSVDVMPDVPTFPLIVFQGVGGPVREYHDQTVAGTEPYRVQVWVWAKDPDEADTIIRAVRLALLGSNFPAVETLGQPVNQHNEPLKLYGRRQDYKIQYTA